MPLTRHPARSAFTFEIKRAHRRTREVITITKTSSHYTSLADEVFGTPSSRPVTLDSNRDPQPLSATPDQIAGTTEDVGLGIVTSSE
jgi:hypothetical protein